MKRTAIVKICVYSILGVVLTSVLVGLLAFDGTRGCGGFFMTSFRYKNAKDYNLITENMELDSSSISRIEINWIGGEITVSKTNSLLSDNIVISESSDKFNLADNDDYVGRYLVKNGTLIIQYCKSMWFVKSNRVEKKINIALPVKEFQELNIDSVSTEIKINDITLNELDVDSVSGDLNLNTSMIKTMNLDMVSGKIKSHLLSSDEVKIDTVSGNIDLEFSKTPSSLEVEGVSANITLTLLDDIGFTAKLDTVSGEISCNFEATISKKQITYLDGKNQFDFETVSGDIKIKK